MTTTTMRPGDYEALLQARLAEVRAAARPRPAASARKARPRALTAILLTSILTLFGAVMALAVHENTSLELDGDTVNDIVAGDDWNDLDDGVGDPDADDSALVSAFKHDEAEPDLSHHEPSNKDDNAIDGPGTNEDWGCVSKPNVNNKDDIRHGYAAAYDIAGDLHLFFGADRDTNNGSSNIAAWFFQNPVSCDPALNDGNFSGHKTDGDLFIVSEFTGGGRVSDVSIYIWTDPNGIVEDGDECLGNGINCSGANSGQDHPFASGIDCQVTDPHADPGSPNVCATVNGDGDGDNDDDDIIDVPWETGSPGDDDPEGSEFFEGGLNLDALFPEGLDCFSQVMLETRSSFEFNANLFDIAFLNFDTCGSIKVIKQTDPDGSAADFDFDLSPDPNAEGTQTLSDGEMFTWDDLNAGNFTLTESNLPAGWALTDISCNDDDVEIEDLGAGTVQLVLDTLENITCTFTNTENGRIEIEKQTLPDGDPATFDFTGDVAATLGDGGSAGEDVAPGNYSSTETIPAGWALTDITCDDSDSSGDTGSGVASFVVAAGETVRCVFTNTKDGRIEIEKQTLPDGDPATFDFTGDVAATLGDGGSAGEDVAPGNYSSTETIPAGWALTDITCDDSDSSGDTGSGVASFVVAAGETVRCVFTNTKDGRIEIEKQTLPDGDPATFDFTGDVAATLGDGGSAGEDVAPGNYSSTETIPAGWALTDITCDDSDSSGDTGSGVASFVVAAGETVRCVFTNTKDGRIEIEKQTLPDGDPATFDFTGDVAATLGDGGSAGEDVAPGNYSSTETIPAGWALTDITCDDSDSSGDTGSGVASFVVAAGETVRCVFTNTKDGRIEIEKQTLPDGDPATFDFTGDVAATLGDGGSAGEDVAPGNYSSTETIPAGWALTDITCDDSDSSGDTGSGVASFVVAAGETVRCVFTNTKEVQNEGCTPGFWQGGFGVLLWNQFQDPDWAANGGDSTWNPFVTSDEFDSFFVSSGNATVDDMTMLEIVGTGGTNTWARKAARDLIAAYLNASFLGSSYPYDTTTILADWATAVAGGTSGFQTFHTKYSAANELGCPIGAPVLLISGGSTGGFLLSV